MVDLNGRIFAATNDFKVEFNVQINFSIFKNIEIFEKTKNLFIDSIEYNYIDNILHNFSDENYISFPSILDTIEESKEFIKRRVSFSKQRKSKYQKNIIPEEVSLVKNTSQKIEDINNSKVTEPLTNSNRSFSKPKIEEAFKNQQLNDNESNRFHTHSIKLLHNKLWIEEESNKYHTHAVLFLQKETTIEKINNSLKSLFIYLKFKTLQFGT